jgi:iron complex outermembrane receptor protein
MGTVTLSHSGTVFNRYINDWIIWLGGAVWTPHNIAAVHSRGAETESRLEWTTGKVTWHASVLTSYILATTVSSYVYNDGSLGRQIPYTPRYNARANAGLAYNRLYLNYNHTYTGYRFTVSDESAWLAPFQTGNVQLQYILKLAARNVLLTAQINNIWNQRYQVVDQRPLPGANWLLGIKADL